VVAVAVAGEAGRRGTTLAADLQIWRLAGMRPPTTGPRGVVDAGAPGEDQADEGPDAAAVVGAALEAATDDGRRRAQGLHVTPGWLADDLAGRALPGPRGPEARPGGPTVCDPACGGGAFLLAAARRLHRLGIDRRGIVRDLLWGADIDPVGLAAAEAVLALWAGEAPPPGRLVVADPLVGGAEAWPTSPAAGFDAVVGNPPFQNQLGRATARTDGDRRGLRARYGAAVRAYTDTAWLFLLLGCDLVRPGGRVVLVQPQSVVAARDAAAVRDAVADRADLQDLWLDGERVFAAAVRVCAPVLERRAAPPPGGPERPTPAGEWGRAWAQAAALPPVDLATAGGGTLGGRAAILAGFRDQYYGLAGAVRERDELPVGSLLAPLVTSGALDWAACSWASALCATPAAAGTPRSSTSTAWSPAHRWRSAGWPGPGLPSWWSARRPAWWRPRSTPSGRGSPRCPPSPWCRTTRATSGGSPPRCWRPRRRRGWPTGRSGPRSTGRP